MPPETGDSLPPVTRECLPPVTRDSLPPVTRECLPPVTRDSLPHAESDRFEPNPLNSCFLSGYILPDQGQTASCPPTD